MSVNNKGIILVHLGYNWHVTLKNLYQSMLRIFCEHQAMASDYGLLSKLLWSLTVHSFDFSPGDIYLLNVIGLISRYQYCGW